MRGKRLASESVQNMSTSGLISGWRFWGTRTLPVSMRRDTSRQWCLSEGASCRCPQPRGSQWDCVGGGPVLDPRSPLKPGPAFLSSMPSQPSSPAHGQALFQTPALTALRKPLQPLHGSLAINHLIVLGTCAYHEWVEDFTPLDWAMCRNCYYPPSVVHLFLH